jgi:type IV pilus assembly protein PilE
MDLLISVAIVGILATLATPSFTAPMNQARRADAVTAAMQVQAFQSRFHAAHGRWASTAELGGAQSSPQGHYRVEVHDAGPVGYRLTAVAQGRQAADTECREMHLLVRHGQLRFGETGGVQDEADRQRARRCWRL